MPLLNDYNVALRAAAEGRDDTEPVTFMLGPHTFSVQLEPTLGDVLEVHAIGEFDPTTLDPDKGEDMVIIQALVGFIRRSLPIDERARWDRALFEIPMRAWPVVAQIAVDITEALTGFPTEPPASSGPGRRSTGRTSKRSSAGRRR